MTEATPHDAASDRVALRLAALQMLLGSGRIGAVISDGLAQTSGNPELARSQTIAVLADLSINGGRRPADIQQITGLTSGGVTKLVDRMEALGVVQRAFGQVPADRRAIVVTLTDHGREVTAAMADGLLARLGDLRETLTLVLELVDAAEGMTPSSGPRPGASPSPRGPSPGGRPPSG
jgi:DNA-binding MarR family transcriptional regulator